MEERGYDVSAKRQVYVRPVLRGLEVTSYLGN